MSADNSSVQIEIPLNIFDEDGNIVDTATSVLTPDQISDIIDHAAEVILTFRRGINFVPERDLEELEEALVVADVIAERDENPVP